jgi:hypothetical protein
MDNHFICPHCRGHLKVGDHIFVHEPDPPMAEGPGKANQSTLMTILR